MPFDILNCQVVTVLTLSEFCDIFLWNKLGLIQKLY